MGIFFVILNVLLLIFALLLFLTAVVLFVPINYELDAAVDEELFVRLKLTWLFGIVKCHYLHQSGESKAELKALWFKIRGGKKDAKDAESKGEDSAPIKSAESIAAKERVVSDDDAADDTDAAEMAREKQPLLDRFLNKCRDIIDMVYEFRDIIEYIDQIPDKKELWDYTVACLKELWRAIKIAVLDISTEIGCGDPDITGVVLSLIYAVKPLYLPEMTVKANFEEPCFKVQLHSNGRSTVWALLYPLIKYVIKKPVWEMIKKLMNRKEEAK